MYAGAAREAVFSVPAVIRRVDADFVPLALRAPLVNGADRVGDPDERWLYQRINRARLAPQGICVLGSAGQVLTWVQMFDDDKSVLDFLDQARRRFQEQADAKGPAVTLRYVKYPSDRAEDHRDDTKLPLVVARQHPNGTSCPAKDGKGAVPPGSLVARLVGRALDGWGKPVADTVRQENYVEDQFSVTPKVQQALLRVLTRAGTARVRLPDEFSKECATHAHLGHIDVRPCLCMLKGRAENKGDWKRCAFWARPAAVGERPLPGGDGKGTALWRIDGQSEVASKVAINGRGRHDVTLAWEGFLEVKGGRVSRLILSARGTEKLQFAKDDHPLKRSGWAEVAFLPGGRPIDVNGGVRYGIIAEPGPAEGGLGKSAGGEAGPAQDVPEEARKQLVEALGGPFLIFRDKVQEELKLSDGQKEKLGEALPEHIQATMKAFEKLQDAKPEEREKAMQEHRQKSNEKLSKALNEVLKADQQERLFQLQLQQAGPFALLGEHKAFAKLKITRAQRKQFLEVVQQMHKKIEPLAKKAQEEGNPEEVRSAAMKVRKEHADKIEALLSGEQKKHWKELLGKPFSLGD